MEPLTAAALEVNQANLALGNEVFEAAGARFVRNTAYPTIYDANHVDDITAATPDDIARLIEAAEREFAGFGHVRFDIDARTPPAFEAELVFDGRYVRDELLVMVLEGELRGDAPAFEIRPIVDQAGWAAFGALLALDWAEDIEDGTAPLRSPAAVVPMAATMRRKSPPVRYWLGYIEGVPRGYLTSWEGTAGVGQVETLFVHPDTRHRGLATALLLRGVADCRAHGAGAVVIVAASDDTPKQMYAAMGWRPVATKRSYTRRTS